MNAPRIWVPKFNIHEAEIRAPTAGVRGFYMLEACNRYGQVKRRLGPWEQLITDDCMDRLFLLTNTTTTASQPQKWCGVGTASPVFTHASSGLGSPVARTQSRSVTNSIDTTAVNGYREEHTATHEFSQGAVVANISEVGNFAGDNNTSAQFLDLVRDSGGSPTTFPVTADDILRVTHIAHRYPFLGSVNSSFNIGGGDGSGVHGYVSSMSGIETSLGGGQNTPQVFGFNLDWDLMAFRDCTALGSITDGAPTNGVSLGTVEGDGENGVASNDGTTWTRTKNFTAGLNDFNHANGINGFIFNHTAGRRCYKFFLDTPIPKFAGSVERILSLEFSCHITRGDGSSS